MFARPLPAGFVVIVMVFDPRIPLPLGPVTVIVTLIWAFGNECVILGIRVKDAAGEIVGGAALMLTVSVRPTEREVLTPVANSVPFALRVAAVTPMSIVITKMDMRSPFRFLSFPVATDPTSLVILGAYARILPMTDIFLSRDLHFFW
jgi:hypothetical protein